ISPTLNATQYGTYSAVVSVGDCSSTDEVTISEQNLEVSLGEDFSSCFVSPEILTAEAINYDPLLASYEWSLNGNILVGETDQTLSITEVGTYSVTITFGTCTATDSITIGIGNIEVNLTDDLQTCFDSEVILEAELSVQNPAATYEWSLDGTVIVGETNSTLIITEIGTYTVTATLGNCTATDIAVVSFKNDLEVTLGEDFQICPNEPRTLTATTVEEGATYQWYLNGTLLAGETNSTLD